MEKSVDWQFDSYMQEIFQMKEVDIREYSPLALAYIGDCIFDLVIKSLVMNEGNKQVQKMHKETSSYVQASAQSKMMRPSIIFSFPCLSLCSIMKFSFFKTY